MCRLELMRGRGGVNVGHVGASIGSSKWYIVVIAADGYQKSV